jgi:hypothetical protein
MQQNSYVRCYSNWGGAGRVGLSIVDFYETYYMDILVITNTNKTAGG